MSIAEPERPGTVTLDTARELGHPETDPRPPRRLRFPWKGSRRTFDALSNPNFRILFIGNIAQAASQQMQQLVRGVLVFQLTGSFAALGLVALANAIPGLLLSPVGGVVADRVPKKTVIQTAQIYNMVNAAVLALLAGFGMLRYEHLVLSAVLQGGVNAIMTPSRFTIIPDLVGHDKLMNAIALNTSGQNLMQLVGPGLGGVLLAAVNAATTFWVMSVLYLIAIMFTVRLPKRPLFSFAEQNARAGIAARRSSGGFRDLIAGIRYVAAEPSIRTLIGVNFLVVLCTMPYTMMLPGFVHEVLHQGAAQQGMLVSVSGIGALVGSLIIASMPNRNRGRLLLIIAVMLASSLVAFSISTNYLITMPIMLFVGAGSAMRLSTGQVLIQTYSADEYRGRVVSVWMMQYALVSFGTFGVGVLSEWLSPQVAIGGLAAGLLVVLILVALFVPRIRNLQ